MTGDAKFGGLTVDFVTGAALFRRRWAQGREAVAHAVGLKKGFRPTVVDATAGLGRDAFVLASLGCRVHMIERSPVVAALLDDGLRRAGQDPEIGGWVRERLSLIHVDSLQGLGGLLFQPDVVYLDPMFPERRKTALVKKEMRLLQTLLGDDGDSDALLLLALKIAGRRVVVKRPRSAGPLGGRVPEAALTTGRHRFDLYRPFVA